MPYIHSDPVRAASPSALPNIEVFEVTEPAPPCCAENQAYGRSACCIGGEGPGWYWWACFPGCLPDGDPFGPFKTEADAIADAQEQD